MLDGLRGYLQLANGLTDVTRERARAAAKALLAQGEAGVGAVVPPPLRAQVAALTDDLVATSRANRDLLVGLVRAEVEHSVARLGLVSAAELEAATRRARLLERRVDELERERAAGRSRARPAASKKTAAPKAAARTTAKPPRAAKRSAATTQAPAKQAPAKQAAPKRATGARTAAKKPAVRR